MRSYAYGFPRLGVERQYKKTIESFWSGKRSEEETRQEIRVIQQKNLDLYAQHVDGFPVGEMTFYDPMLDTAIMLGIFRPKDLKEYYELCRGKNALEMTKWFNTNYHYLVPDFSQIKNPVFSLHWNKPKEYLDRFQRGIPTVHVLEIEQGRPQESTFRVAP